MNKYVIFLRGVNVGGNNLLPMAELKEMLTQLGCTNCQSYIQSGNVTLTSDLTSKKLATSIQNEILSEKGFKIDIHVMTIKAFMKSIKQNPYPTEIGKLLHFFFINASEFAPNLDLLEALKSNTEQCQIIGQVFYLYAPDGIGRSKLAAKVEKIIGQSVTARNWNTVQKMLKLTQN